jgi:methyl-accepting chemotaxis protein
MLNRLKNLSIPHRLYAAFAVQVLLLVAASLFVYGHVSEIRSSVVRVVAVSLPRERAVQEMERSTDSFSSAVLRFQTELDAHDKRLAQEAIERFSTNVDHFKKLARTNSQRSLLREIYSLHGELQVTGTGLMTAAEQLAQSGEKIELDVNELVTKLDENTSVIDRGAVGAAELIEASYGIRGALQQASSAARHYRLSPTPQLRNEATSAINRFTRHASVYDALAARGEIYPWLAAARDRGDGIKTKIADHFDLVDNNSRELLAFRSGSSDLMARLTEGLRPQIMQERNEVQRNVDSAVASAQAVVLMITIAGLCLGAALAMWSSIGIMRPLQEAVRKLSETSNKLADSSAERSSGAQEQVASVAESMATVTEVARTAEQAADRASSVADSVRQTDTVAKSGRSAVGMAVTAMARAKDQTHSIAENIVALAEQAKAIGEIITSVNDIAEQTNLLSLNASIEASRAGEHGKGFQVVAGEVKELAGQSKMATRQVREILGEIQKATSSAVLSTEDGTHTVENAVDVVSQAGDTINSLAETIANAADAASQIASHATQQATAMTQIKSAMSDIDKVAQNNATSAKAIQGMAADLSGLGAELQALVRGGLG